jgi:hypothetical protein
MRPGPSSTIRGVVAHVVVDLVRRVEVLRGGLEGRVHQAVGELVLDVDLHSRFGTPKIVIWAHEIFSLL